MPRRCTVCAHPKRTEIDAALAAGESKRGIARRHGLDDSSVERHAGRHLRPRVVAAAKAKAEAGDRRLAVTIETVLEGLARVAFGDIRKLFGPDGKLRPIHELEEEVAAALAGIEVVTKADGSEVVHVHKVKTADRIRALEILARHLGMLRDSPTVAVLIGERITDDERAAIEDYTGRWKESELEA